MTAGICPLKMNQPLACPSTISENCMVPVSTREEALGKLAEVLNKQTDIDVFIEGHTDNKPINTVQFKDNWDLSVIRATSVVRILIKNYNVNPLQIQPSGRGEYMPVDDNETIEGRSKNRRTEIIMAPKLDKLFQMLQSSEESK